VKYWLYPLYDVYVNAVEFNVVDPEVAGIVNDGNCVVLAYIVVADPKSPLNMVVHVPDPVFDPTK
jgi:hypothetical protein